jgi:hypothetical protein
MADDLEKKFPCTPSGSLALAKALLDAGMTNDKFLSLRPQNDQKGIKIYIRYCEDMSKNPRGRGFRLDGSNATLHSRMLKHYEDLLNRGHSNHASSQPSEPLESPSDNTSLHELSTQALGLVAQSASLAIEDSVFEDREFIEARVTIAKRDHSFRGRVLRHYGLRCAVCPVSVTSLIQAAHIQPVKDGGSDSVSNGLPLCANHHIAFDCHLWCIDPNTKKIVTNLGLDPQALGIDEERVDQKLSKEVLIARYPSFLSHTRPS